MKISTGIFTFVTAVLLGLKLAGVLNISYWTVFTPLFVGAGLVLLTLIFAVVFVTLAEASR